MKTIMQKYQIIQLKKKGWSNNRIHKEFGISRNTIRKYWNDYQEKCDKLTKDNTGLVNHDVIESLIENPKYDSSNRKPRKYTQEIDDLLRKILGDEETKTERLGKNHKQALTSRQIFELIKKQGYDIGESTIRRKIREIRGIKKEAFIKQDYEYGERFEYDFGEVKLIIDGKYIKAYLAVISCPASGFRWAYLYRNSKMDVFLESHALFFEMIGGSLKEGVYDNMKNVVSKFIGKNEKVLNEQLIQLALYYDFEINVTNCFSGNEKGTVESAVKWIRNKVFALEYEFNTFQEACDFLQDNLIEINKDSSIEEEKKHLNGYRPMYETAVITEKKVDKYSFIHLDNNSYSVPEDLCEKWVTTKMYPRNIIVLYKNEVVAQHERIDGKGKTCIDILHYLHTFSKKPGALANSLALKSTPKLKKLFDKYYKEKPKTFIEIIRNCDTTDIDELINALEPKKQQMKVQEAIDLQTENQIQLAMGLMIGGKKHVH